MALEAVLIAALLAAHLAVPSQLLQPLGLDAIADLRAKWVGVKLLSASALLQQQAQRRQLWFLQMTYRLGTQEVILAHFATLLG